MRESKNETVRDRLQVRQTALAKELRRVGAGAGAGILAESQGLESHGASSEVLAGRSHKASGGIQAGERGGEDQAVSIGTDRRRQGGPGACIDQKELSSKIELILPKMYVLPLGGSPLSFGRAVWRPFRKDCTPRRDYQDECYRGRHSGHWAKRAAAVA